MVVDVCDKFQIRSSDGMNWQVYELKTVEERKNYRSTGNKVEKWVGLASYHATPSGAVEWIARHMSKTRSDRVKRDLNGFLDEYQKIANKIARGAKKFERVIQDGNL